MGDDDQVVESTSPAWAEADGAAVEVRQKREGKTVTVIEGGEDKAVEKAEKPKRRAPRKKKSEEEKELFPFYEQSLF